MATQILFDKAFKAYQEKNFTKAQKYCHRVMQMQPLNYDALHLGGLLAISRGEKFEAIQLIKRSLAIQPSQPSALNNIGNIYRKLDRYDESLAAFREAIRLKPDFADAWANMAIAYYDQDENIKAEDRARAALKLQPDHYSATHTLGLVHLNNDDLDLAAEAFIKCSKFEHTEGFSPSWYAQILAHLERFDEAKKILGKLLEREPDNASARFQYDAISGAKLQRASSEAVKEVFDHFATSFDKTLKNLNYRAPELVVAQVMKVYSTASQELKIADLGCGTGLVGPMLAPITKKLVGVDLSPEMLKQAKQREIYDELIEMDLIGFLADGSPDEFDLITCADTLNYLGALDEVMIAVSHALSPGGLFVATFEHGDETIPDDEGYRLHHAGRFHHSESYVKSMMAAAGLSISMIEFAQLRKQGGKPVNGMIISAVHAAE